MNLIDFEKWILKEFKINLSAYKSNQLHRRILSLMSRVGASSVDEYIGILKRDEVQKQRFLDFFTINVTEFFRNPEFFQDLKHKISLELLPKNKNLKVWSAACSNGSEPYSLAMILEEVASDGRHNILATDIDSTILERAKKGEFTVPEVKNVSKNYLDKYFNKVDEKYVVKFKLKNMVAYKKHDLILDSYENNFDLIVCRNVVIYFNQEVKNEIYKKFNSSLKKGGLLFVGATESIYNYKDFGFEKSSTFIYKKI